MQLNQIALMEYSLSVLSEIYEHNTGTSIKCELIFQTSSSNDIFKGNFLEYNKISVKQTFYDESAYECISQVTTNDFSEEYSDNPLVNIRHQLFKKFGSRAGLLQCQLSPLFDNPHILIAFLTELTSQYDNFELKNNIIFNYSSMLNSLELPFKAIHSDESLSVVSLLVQS